MSKTETTTEVALVTSPGTAVPGTAVPDAVVVDVAQTIREMHRTAGLQFAYDVGQLILTKFYGGNVAAFRSHAAKDSSLRRLAEQPEMPLGRSALHQAVEVHLVLERRGGVQTLGRLSPSHVRTVLALPAPEQDKLLAKAEAKALTVKQLEAEARKAKSRAGKGKGGGRPALPAFVKSIHALGKYVDGDLFGGLEAVDELGLDEAQTLYSTVSGLKARCEELLGRLGGRVVERATPPVEAPPEEPVATAAKGRARKAAQVAEHICLQQDDG
jgi:hypothetical protein